jgi:hypothetical protein
MILQQKFRPDFTLLSTFLFTIRGHRLSLTAFFSNSAYSQTAFSFTLGQQSSFGWPGRIEYSQQNACHVRRGCSQQCLPGWPGPDRVFVAECLPCSMMVLARISRGVNVIPLEEYPQSRQCIEERVKQHSPHHSLKYKRAVAVSLEH